VKAGTGRGNLAAPFNLLQGGEKIREELIMKKEILRIYDDGAEFLDDIYNSNLEENLSKEEFADFTFSDFAAEYEVEFPNEEKELKKYYLWESMSGDFFLISAEKSLYEWYQDWQKV